LFETENRNRNTEFIETDKHTEKWSIDQHSNLNRN
jgi:hypothetical protein